MTADELETNKEFEKKMASEEVVHGKMQMITKEWSNQINSVGILLIQAIATTYDKRTA